MSYETVPSGFTGRKPAGVKTWTSWMGPDARDKKEVNAVFKGGGPKGAAYAGTLEVLQDHVAFPAVAGASAGAITAALLAAGYSAETLTERIGQLDFGTLLDERTWTGADTAVQRAYYSAKQQESPDLLTRLIANNAELSKLMALPEEVQREWQAKGWGSYLWDYGWWLYDQADSSARSAFTYLLGNNAGYWGYEAVKAGAGVYTSGPLYWALSKAVMGGGSWAASYYFSGETNPLVSVSAFNQYAPKIIITMMQRSLQGSDLPMAIASKLKDERSTLKILLGLYYLGGAFKGDTALNLIEQWLQEAVFGTYDRSRSVRFKDLPIPLHIVATDLTNKRLLQFPDGLAEAPYGYRDPGSFSVAKAVRASMSIPLCFEPVELPYESGSPEAGNRAYLVDGGVLSNYPVHMFAESEIPTVGFWLGDDLDGVVPNNDSTVMGYSSGMFGALQEAHDRTMVRLMGDRLISAQIDLSIPLTDAEKEKHAELGKELEKKIAVADEQNRGVEQLKLSQQLQQLNDQLDKGRLCGTLDFALSQEQKDGLIANGRKAGLAALAKLGLD